MSLYSDLNEVLTPYAHRIKTLFADISNKADKSTTYTKNEVDDELSGIQADLGDLFVASKNLFNKDDIVDGKYISTNNGIAADSSSMSASNYIKIEPNTSYIISTESGLDSIRYALYDLSKTYIIGRKSAESFTTPNNARYIRFSVYTSVIDSAQLEKGDTKSDYVPYEKYIHPEYIWSDKLESDVQSIVQPVSEALDSLDEAVNGLLSKNYIEGKNLTVSAGVYSIYDDEGSCISEDIPITWTWQVNDYVNFYYNDSSDKIYQIWFLDENKTPISYYGRNPAPTSFRSVKMPANSAYIRFSFKKGTIGVLNGSSVVYYTATETVVEAGFVQKIGDLDSLVTEEKDSLVGAINEVAEAIPDKITPKDTTFFVGSANLVNPDGCVLGQYVNQTNGIFSNNSNHKRTDYIAVEPSKSYFCVASNNVSNDIRYAFYKSDKTFISGGLITASQGLQVITSPANAAYMVSSVGTTANDIMIAQTDTVIPFEPYALYIDKQYINLGSEIVLNLPAKIYAVVGYELNIYFENITEDWTKYDWNVDCTVGKQMERGYTITPTASDVGTKTLTIKATDEHGNVKTVISSLIITSASAGSGSSKSVIVLGDSTTNNGIAVTKLNENFADDVMNLSTLGTRGTSPNLHEGRSGWKLSDYFTKEYIDYTDGRGHVENPFYNPTSQTFDASYYFANSGVSVPDFFIVNMGINDVFGAANDAALSTVIEQVVGYVDSIITSLRAVSQTLKICICCTIPPNHSQDAFGKAYACSQTRNGYKRNNTMLVERLIDEYDGRESEEIYLIPIHTNLDTVYNMGMETLPVNARNTDVTYQSPIANGGVHPVASGYWQIADVYTAFLKANA